MALSTSIKELFNKALWPIGFKVGTTLVDNRETARLEDLTQAGHWEAAKYTSGIVLDGARQFRFLEEVVKPYQSGYVSMPMDPNGASGEYYLNNAFFGGVDAEVLYAAVRHYKPHTVFEIGSGFSTQISRKAIIDGKLDTRLVSVDPGSSIYIDSIVDERLASRVEKLAASDIYGRLRPGDILFIDSSHVITSGGDISFLFLEVLPNLAEGVIVHVHDIFMPFEYPKDWVVTDRRGYNEQYLVHAFLCFNPAFEILWLSNFMWRQHQPEVTKVLPRGATPRAVPSSLWMMRVNGH